MSDWIEQLERLTRLHKDGVLTDEEFAIQKGRLLKAQTEPEPQPAAIQEAEQVSYDEAEYEAPRSRWPLFAGIAAVAALVIGGAAWFGSGIVPDQELAKPMPTSSAPPVAIAEPTVEPTEAPAPVALDGTLAFSSPSLCQAGDTLDRIYKKLAAGMDIGSGQGLTVQLDAFDAPLQITAKSGKDADGATTASADVRFPEDTTWHGLKLSRITTSRFYPADTDGTDTRTINFRETPDKVRKTLARLGFGAPLSPDYAPINEGEGCGGSMQIEARPGGSALVCNWGC